MSARETTSVAHDELIPLSTLETMLTVGDNMHKVNYQHGKRSLPVLMTTIRRYTKLEDSGIFEYYYGYLCMRHLMRTVCIGTLIESIVLERFLNNLDPDMGAVEATDALAQVAFDLMTQALEKNDLSYVGLCLGFKPPSWDVFQCVGGLSFHQQKPKPAASATVATVAPCNGGIPTVATVELRSTTQHLVAAVAGCMRGRTGQKDFIFSVE
ncbi:hypothetical protein FRC09_018859 [Ceratobasidium sp. 395]|nr:hypothetical protein FRC09_018859 [Ceratobasidium sp. 395]